MSLGGVLACVSFVAPAAFTGNVAELSLEDHMNIKDTSVSRKAQQLDEAISRNVEHQPREAAAPSAAVPDTLADGLDRVALDNIRALDQSGSSALLQRVIGMYLKSTPDLVRAMRRAVDAGDAAAVGTAAHSLKSSSLNIGAARLGNLCREIEAAARSTPPATSAALVAALESEYLRVEQLLRSELENGDA